MKKQNTNKGITLIALVITIIVMLILVSVTISMAVNGGLFDYAKKAASGMENARDQELGLADLAPGMTVDELINKFTNSEGGTGSGVIPVPDEEDVFESFNVGVEEGTVTAYVVENAEATASAGEPIYDMLIIGNGEMNAQLDWEDNLVVEGHIVSEYEANWNVKIENIIISEGVTSIGASAFLSCTNLTNVIIPNSVTTIGSKAFKGCTNLTSVTIPDSVTTIGGSAFRGCTGLTNVILSNNLTDIYGYAFGYTGITSITIPDSVTYIGYDAFGGCEGLTSVTLPVNLTDFDQDAFYYSVNLTTINYRGTEEQWGDKVFRLGFDDNEHIVYFNGTINYNYNG